MAEKEKEKQEIINNKNEVVQKLNNYKSSSSLQLKSAQEEHQYIQDENQKLQSKFKLVNDENETIKQRLEEQNKEYSLLQEKYTQLNEESVSFDQKLKELINKNNELHHSIEVVTIENNDYLGRLRAISSVVDVVGTAPNRIISLESSVN
jgi:chromosome segregation ATPase